MITLTENPLLRPGGVVEDIWFGKLRKISQIIKEDIFLHFYLFFWQELCKFFIVKGSLDSTCQ